MLHRLKVDPHIDDERFKSLLERWTDGEFTRADEQELQNLTRDDDFRREAAEGYMAAPDADHAVRLQRMRAHLRQQGEAPSGGARIFTLPRMMAAAAALALLLIAFRYFSVQPSDTTAEGPIAQVTTPAPAGSAAREVQFPQPPPANAKGIPEPLNTIQRQEKPAPGTSGATAGASRVATPELNDAVQPTQPAAEADLSATQDIEDQPVAKPSPPAAAAPKEYVAVKKESEKAQTNIPQKADSNWHDTEKRSEVESVRKALREVTRVPAYSEPADGWEAFSDYLRQSARLPSEARNHNVSGSVRLQFTVGEDGTPFSFVFLRRLGYGCEEEAVRLVKGWEWVRGQNPLTTVEIPFVR